MIKFRALDCGDYFMLSTDPEGAARLKIDTVTAVNIRTGSTIQFPNPLVLVHPVEVAILATRRPTHAQF